MNSWSGNTDCIDCIIVHVTTFLTCLKLFDSLPRGTPNLWVHPMATSQPNSPGDFRTVRARRSVAHTAKAFRKNKMAITTTFNNNRVFPSYKNTRFQNEAECKTSLVKMSSMCMRIKIIFILINGFTRRLSLKQRFGATWKRFITIRLIRLLCTILYQLHVTALQ